MEILCNMGTAMDIIGTLGVNKWCEDKGYLTTDRLDPNNPFKVKPYTFSERDEIIRSRTEEALEDMFGFIENIIIGEHDIAIELSYELINIEAFEKVPAMMKDIMKRLECCHIKVHFNITHTTVCNY